MSDEKAAWIARMKGRFEAFKSTVRPMVEEYGYRLDRMDVALAKGDRYIWRLVVTSPRGSLWDVRCELPAGVMPQTDQAREALRVAIGERLRPKRRASDLPAQEATPEAPVSPCRSRGRAAKA